MQREGHWKKFIVGCMIGIAFSGCQAPIIYRFTGSVCEQGIVTVDNVNRAKEVFSQVEVGSVVISRTCYDSKIIRPTKEAIEKKNK